MNHSNLQIVQLSIFQPIPPNFHGLFTHPGDPENDQLCDAIVKCLCQEPYPQRDTKSIKQFNETLSSYKNYLSEICTETAESRQLVIDGCLRSLYRQLVQPGRPCVAAATVLALFDAKHIPSAVRWMLTSGENSSDEALTSVFHTLARWLTETNNVENIHVWLCELLSGLFEERRYDLLFELAIGCAPRLLETVKLPVFRAQTLAVLHKLLVCDGRAPKLFHVVLPKLSETIRFFNGHNREQEIQFLRTIQALLMQFPESGDRYKEIVS